MTSRQRQQRSHRKSVKEAPNTLTPPGSPDNDVPIAIRAMPPESSELKTLIRVQKRNERMAKIVSSLEKNINTPRSKAKRLIHWANNKKIKKELTFHNCVLEDLKAKYGALRSDRQRQTRQNCFPIVF